MWEHVKENGLKAVRRRHGGENDGTELPQWNALGFLAGTGHDDVDGVERLEVDSRLEKEDAHEASRDEACVEEADVHLHWQFQQR